MFEKIRHSLLSDQKYFRQEGEGYSFYPWNYPCEGISLNKEEALRVAGFILSYLIWIPVYIMAIIMLDYFSIISSSLFDYLVFAFCIFVVPAYFALAFFAKKNKEVITNEVKDKKSITIKSMNFLIIVLAQTGFFIYALMPPVSLSGIFILLYVLSIIFTVYLFFKIIRTNGNFFTG